MSLCECCDASICIIMSAELAEVTEAFLQSLTAQRLSEHTIKNYRRDLQQLLGFADRESLTDWAVLSSKQLRKFITENHRSGLSARSIHRQLSAIRSFYRYLVRQGLSEHNPAVAVQAPKTEKRLPSTLDVDQTNALLDATPEDTFVASRDRAIMELLYSSGLRVSELAALDLRDIDFAEQLVHVIAGKGGKGRIVPMGSQAITAIKHWLEMRDRRGFFSEQALFVSQQGRRLGVRSIQQRLSYWGKRLGISDKVHPHRLRHAFASHMLESSGDLRAVQELLGHADISTTQVYTHLDFQHLAKVYDAAHPRAKKRS